MLNIIWNHIRLPNFLGKFYGLCTYLKQSLYFYGDFCPGILPARAILRSRNARVTGHCPFVRKIMKLQFTLSYNALFLEQYGLALSFPLAWMPYNLEMQWNGLNVVFKLLLITRRLQLTGERTCPIAITLYAIWYWKK